MGFFGISSKFLILFFKLLLAFNGVLDFQESSISCWVVLRTNSVCIFSYSYLLGYFHSYCLTSASPTNQTGWCAQKPLWMGLSLCAQLWYPQLMFPNNCCHHDTVLLRKYHFTLTNRNNFEI